MSRALLFVGGGIETLPGVRRAHEMGLRVLVSDRNPEAPCMKVADRALLADTYDATATIAALERADERPDGALCLATDVPLTVAHVTAHFSLPGLSLETARLASDKLAMKDRLQARGVAIPWFAPVGSVEELARLRQEKPWPLVVKPVDSRGARGVIRLTETVDSGWAFTCAHGFSPTGRVMVERYLPGPQVSTESLVVGGRVHTPGFSDRNYALLERFAPYFIEDGGELPSALDTPARDALVSLVAKAATALGVHDGVVKGDLVWSEGRPYVIEVATRLSGGYFCSHTIPVSTGVDLLGLAIRQALGEEIDESLLIPNRHVAVCQRYFFPKPGRVVAIEGLEQAREIPGVFHLELRVAVGDEIAPIANHPGRAGVVMTTGADAGQARSRAERAVDVLRIITRAGIEHR